MSKKKIAFITGITGQDGAYLARLLLSKNYEVHGMKRRSSSINTKRIDDIYVDPHIKNRDFYLHYGDLTDSLNIFRLLKDIGPNEIYNLGAQSHVKVSFETAEYTANADAIGTLRLLEAIKTLSMEKNVKFYQASTSELFGKNTSSPQDENTPFYPRSPYGVAKLYSYWITVNYREAFNFHASNGILFNHESPLRGETFVTQKIALGVANIKAGKQDCLYLGNLHAKRDWGHAKDYVYGMWKILQQKNPDDYVLATGRSETVKRFVELAFQNINKEIIWTGKGLKEKGICKKTKKVLVKVDPRYFRPTEVDFLLGNPSKALKKLGWKPKISLEKLVKEMIEIALIDATQKNTVKKIADF